MRRLGWTVLFLGLFLRVCAAGAAVAQGCEDNPTNPDDADPGFVPGGGNSPAPENCSGGFHCYEPRMPSGPYISQSDPNCDPQAGPCGVDLHVPWEFPGNAQNPPSEGAAVYVFGAGGVQSCLPPAHCDDEAFCGGAAGQINVDFGEVIVPGGPVQCPNTEHPRHRPHGFLGWTCITCCHQNLPYPNIDFSPPAVAAALGCNPPKKGGCDGESCEDCGEGGTPFGGGGPGFSLPGLAGGPGAKLRYLAGGVGHMNHPGSRQWNVELGRYWVHDYAMRISLDPDAGHVWLLRETGNFREFWDDDADGVYERVSPSNEYRTLAREGQGWSLTDLEGTVQHFDAQGKWTSTADRFGNAKTATYANNRLSRVDFPDGRREDFAYHLSGMLASITEVGIDGTTARTWRYFWNGFDLAKIEQPDGLWLEFFYEDDRHPGYLTRLQSRHATALATVRVLRAWEYDEKRNVVRTWKGDAFWSGPNAVEKWSFAYDDPSVPTQTTVTDPLGGQAVYLLEREPGSDKARVTSLSSPCPVCASGPHSARFFDDPAHPLLPTRVIDGEGHETQYEYDSHGRKTLQIEAVGEPEARVTEWEYHPSWPALVTAVVGPYPVGAVPTRRLEMDYDASGRMTHRRETGVEKNLSGVPSTFVYETVYTYNAAGQVLTLDPPGHGNQDQVSFTYDAARGDLLPLSRTDALGTVSFAYDALNRRIGATDLNGVLTETRYDAMGRVTFTIQRSDPASQPGDPILTADLVHEQRYSLLGELYRALWSGGGWSEQGYDAAGRLVSRALFSPTQGTYERTVWTLDGDGNRVREEQQSYNGTAFVTETWTDFVYSTRCHLDKLVHADGTAIEYDYDCDGNLAHVWDEAHPRASHGPTQTYTYDPLHRLTLLSQPWTGGSPVETRYAYDAQDHLVEVTDGEGNATSYEYSDRDLLTHELSPVSGETRHGYDEHGQLVASIDARGIRTDRILDAADRVTILDLPGTELDTTYTYDDPLVPYAQGRLTRIARGGTVVDQAYDRFGRLTQDGALSYVYDENGDPLEILYPGGVRAVYTYVVPGRARTLVLKRDGEVDVTLVNKATYRAGGPVKKLDLDGSLTETHSFNTRGLPTEVKVATTSASKLDWLYTTDAVGNVTGITQTVPSGATPRVYGYRDYQYFLTQGDGPWGTRGWTYDRIGNRLTETRSGVTDTYSYVPNGSGGHTALLDSVSLGGGGVRDYTYGPAGHLDAVASSGNQVHFTHDATGQLSRLERPAAGASTDLLFDGRGYLTLSTGELPPVLYPERAETSEAPAASALATRGTPGTPLFADGFEDGTVCAWTTSAGDITPPPTNCPKPQLLTAAATYSSAGVLHHLHRDSPSGGERELFYFYFQSRPVAQLERLGDSDAYRWIATDHLGTPIGLVERTTQTHVLVWHGGFEPFGKDFSGASAAGISLRFPGQWTDPSWETAAAGADVYYNVNRWYEWGTGRYERADPLGTTSDPSPYSYTGSRPTTHQDPMGLATVPSNAIYYICCVNGKRTVCKGDTTAGTDFDVATCEKEHEQKHVHDLDIGRYGCSPCTKGLPKGSPVTTPEKKPVECSGYCEELVCLRRKMPRPPVRKRIEFVQRQIGRYCDNGLAGCVP